MPCIGYGTYKCTDGSDERIVRMALDAGYRMLDTAAAYENEEYVGRAVRESKIPREEIFLTSKVWKTNLGYEKTKQSFEASLNRLQTDYLDLFLLHWPKPDPEAENWKELDMRQQKRQPRTPRLRPKQKNPRQRMPGRPKAQTRRQQTQKQLLTRQRLRSLLSAALPA